MAFKFPQIPMPLFYKIGSFLFSVSAIGSAINLKMQWDKINLGGKISMFATFFFQLLIVTLFLGFYFATRNQPKIIENPELDKFLQELKADDEKVKTKISKKEMKGGKLEDGKKNFIKN